MKKIIKTNKNLTLNADVGEGYDDGLVMPYLDCANIACGEHAGNTDVMRETLILAKRHNVTVGAHPGYPDRDNFGRYSLTMHTDELIDTLTVQIGRLVDLAAEQEITVAYVKPHGALNHDMLQKVEIFAVICQVVANINNNLAIMIPTNANHEKQQRVARQHGLTIWWEVFADRAYQADGLLRSRDYDDAVHADPQIIIEQLNRIYTQGEIIAVDNSVLDVSVAQTICLHGDNTPSITALQSWTKPV